MVQPYKSVDSESIRNIGILNDILLDAVDEINGIFSIEVWLSVLKTSKILTNRKITLLQLTVVLLSAVLYEMASVYKILTTPKSEIFGYLSSSAIEIFYYTCPQMYAIYIAGLASANSSQLKNYISKYLNICTDEQASKKVFDCPLNFELIMF